MHKFFVEKKLEKIMTKLERKNSILYNQLKKKMNEVINAPDVEHYKNLMYDLKELKRTHVGSFVLVFKYDKQKDFIYFIDFDYHDKIYKKSH